MEFCSKLCGSLDGRGLGGEWTHAYIWLESPHCPPETITMAISQYKIKFFLKEMSILESDPQLLNQNLWD